MGLFDLFAGVGILGKIFHENVKEDYVAQTVKEEMAAKEEAERKHQLEIKKMTDEMNKQGIYNTSLQERYLLLYVGASMLLKDPKKGIDAPNNKYDSLGLRPQQRLERAIKDFELLGYHWDPNLHIPSMDVILRVNIY